MKKPRIFYLVIVNGMTLTAASNLQAAQHRVAVWDFGKFDHVEFIKVQELNESRTTKAKAPRTKTKTSRPKRISSTGKARHKPRVQKVAGQGKAAYKESGKGKGKR